MSCKWGCNTLHWRVVYWCFQPLSNCSFIHSGMTGCWWDSVIRQTPLFRLCPTHTTGKATRLMTSQTTAPCYPSQSCRKRQWRGSTTLTRLLGEMKDCFSFSLFELSVGNTAMWCDCRRFGFFNKKWDQFYFNCVFFFFLIPRWLYWVSKSLLFLIIPSLLWLYLRARHGRDGHSYCSVKGCERVKITATTSSKETCNCTAKAYPKYAKAPSVVVPMPALNTQPCRDCGAKQVC